MTFYLGRGIVIGLLFGLPVGAVGALTVQRTLRYGWTAGLLTGLGSSAADCLYASIGVFGLTFAADLLLTYQIPINFAGAGLIALMGVRLIGRRQTVAAPSAPTARGIKMLLSSFAVSVANPAAILAFVFAFSYFGLIGQLGVSQGLQLVCGVFIGTYIWWGVLTASCSVLKRRAAPQQLYWANKIFGALLLLFGVIIFIRTCRLL